MIRKSMTAVGVGMWLAAGTIQAEFVNVVAAGGPNGNTIRIGQPSPAVTKVDEDTDWFMEADKPEIRDNLWWHSKERKYFESACRTEDSPRLKTRITGLDSSRSYEVYVMYVGFLNTKSHPSAFYGIAAALAGQPVRTYHPQDGTEKPKDCRAKLGTVEGVTEFSVEIDDVEVPALANFSPADIRSIYKGVTYEAVEK